MLHLILAPTAFDRGTVQPGLHELTLAEAESAYIRGTARPATAAERAAAEQRLAALSTIPDEPTLETAAAAPTPERATARRPRA